MKERTIVLVTTAPSLHRSTRELATRLADRAAAVLLFLHVVPLRRQDGEAMLYSALEMAQGEAEAWLRGQRPTDAGTPFRHRLEVGDPEEVVARFVAGHEVELVVAEEPPRSWVSQALWRGLAERLIRRVSCPVVVGGPGFLQADAPEPAPVPRRPRGSNMAELLNATVEARVDALRCWMDHCGARVRRVADGIPVQTAVSLACGPGSVDPACERQLRLDLEEHRRAMRARRWQLAAGGRVWSQGSVTPTAGRALGAFLERVQDRGHSTSLPLTFDDGEDRLYVLGGATVADGRGLLLMAFDAEDDFLRILGQPGPVPSFESYAFDGDGLMLSNSLFPDVLIREGLLPDDGVQTALRIRVAAPSDGPVQSWPLTHSVQQAIRHSDGCDTRGYQDYRGVPVVGAWRWLEDYGFGVAAEVDRAAAYA